MTQSNNTMTTTESNTTNASGVAGGPPQSGGGSPLPEQVPDFVDSVVNGGLRGVELANELLSGFVDAAIDALPIAMDAVVALA